jgi:hypothetical protein
MAMFFVGRRLTAPPKGEGNGAVCEGAASAGGSRAPGPRLGGACVRCLAHGKRFLVVTPPRDQSEPPDLVVIQHWDEELKARVPVK